jgi:predicted transport protein
MREEIHKLYEELDKKILALDENIQKNYNKHYVAYKYDYSNFAEIIIYKWSLNLQLDILIDDIIDENEVCEDVSNIGTYGTGNIQIKLRNNSDIDYIMNLIKQSLENVKRGE